MSASVPSREQGIDVTSVDARNPWPGLASFREADRRFFRGREAESEALVRLVRRARLTVLFGLSGLGKTSLLRAGVFPRIRGDDMLPALVRLDFSPNSPPLGDQVRKTVAAAAAAAGVDGARSLVGASLWESFHRRGLELWSERHKLVAPLLVFDQFEEIFTLGRRDATTQAASETFLEELADLVEARPPESLKARLEQEPATARQFSFGRHPYKVMLSLREDFLPQLEELRDRMGSLAHNRFRLRPMNGEAALNVVTQAPELIEAAVAERVVRFVAAAGPEEHEFPLRDLRVEPALLSVVCRELNNRRRQRGEDRISASLLEEKHEEILGGLYERSVADVPVELRTFVEEELLTVSGYRDSVALENALERPGFTREHLDRLVDRRLVRIEERGGVQRLELTHDLLTGVVAISRDQRRHREREEEERRGRLEAEAEAAASRRQLRRSRLVAALFLLLAVGAGLLALWAVNQRKLAKEAAAEAERLKRNAEQTAGELQLQLDETQRERMRAQIAELKNLTNRLRLKASQSQGPERDELGLQIQQLATRMLVLSRKLQELIASRFRFRGDLDWLVRMEGHKSKPYWPGGMSGVTLDPNIDLGHTDRKTVRKHYEFLLTPNQLEAVLAVVGLKGEEAKQALATSRELQSIRLSRQDVARVVPEMALPFWEKIVDRFPRLAEEDTPPSVQTALLSLAFNRGPANRHLQVLEEPIARGDWGQVAELIGAMQQDHALPGIRERRRAEADLIRAELGIPDPAPA